MEEKKETYTIHTEVFWGEIAPCHHVVQLYENDEEFLGNLEAFVKDGFDSDDSVIIIASPEHLRGLNERLKSTYDLEKLQEEQIYFCLNAEECLSQFMVDGWPDEARFMEFVSSLILLGRKNGRRVRAFGEMVAILWADGQNGATVQLEHLWSKFCELEVFSLLCAYPKTGFTQDFSQSMENICRAHSHLIHSNNPDSSEITYSRMSNYGATA